jgi:hypothetical protein
MARIRLISFFLQPVRTVSNARDQITQQIRDAIVDNNIARNAYASASRRERAAQQVISDLLVTMEGRNASVKNNGKNS